MCNEGVEGYRGGCGDSGCMFDEMHHAVDSLILLVAFFEWLPLDSEVRAYGK